MNKLEGHSITLYEGNITPLTQIKYVHNYMSYCIEMISPPHSGDSIRPSTIESPSRKEVLNICKEL